MREQDNTIAPRDGEHLPLERVDQWLKSQCPHLQGQPQIRQFPAGASNLTYRLAYDNDTFILRRPPFGKLPAGAHDVAREAKLMQALKPHYPYVPEVRLICTDHRVMACDFYLMSEVRGLILRRELPDSLPASPTTSDSLCRIYIEGLARLHNLDIKCCGLEGLGKGEGYMQRQISGWRKRLERAKTEDVADFLPISEWLDANQPAEDSPCVIHNDYRFDNLVLDPDSLEVIGVLDWELATLGDPLMDLGSALAYWVEPQDHTIMQQVRLQPTHLPGMLSRDDMVAAYFEATGRDPVPFGYYQIFGLFRLAGIVQQIYQRYFTGQTKDARFAGFGHLSNHLHQRCLALMEQQ
ncbi:phosphotransferase family protein [Bowmanella dokdonensis]|uniref:Phosphotransferase family protein n=1 Tax=Bowmanella dokdonensis TaxID=751969 RepID=A0A939DLW4_9ALTE|nr:phosphotransferase family protein [Bowmanella dokdonensis]MBN7825037.1 phosphotransferase family protein [Bowmanella dokdonensis]